MAMVISNKQELEPEVNQKWVDQCTLLLCGDRLSLFQITEVVKLQWAFSDVASPLPRHIYLTEHHNDMGWLYAVDTPGCANSKNMRENLMAMLNGLTSGSPTVTGPSPWSFYLKQMVRSSSSSALLAFTQLASLLGCLNVVLQILYFSSAISITE